MASIAKRPDGQWRARYRDAAGHEHAKHFPRKLDAQRWLDGVTSAVVTGSYVDPKAGRITLRSYAQGWEASHLGRPASARIIDNALRRHVLPRLGDRPVASLRRSDIQALVTALSRTHSAATVHGVYGVLSRVLASAVDDRVIPSSPCSRIAQPKDDKVEVVPPSVSDVARLADAIDARYRAAAVLLAGSGLRIGELLGLRVSDVDFLRRTVRVERQRGPHGEIAAPKTAKSVRTVPLGGVVIDELAAHLAAYPSPEWLFTTRSGEPLEYRKWRVIWNAARTKAALPTGTHDLRHFFASALIAGGASVKQVQSVLGHSSAVVTLEIYSHLWPGDDDRTRAVIDSTLDVLRTSRGLGDPQADVVAGQEA